MRRIISVLAVAALMAAMMLSTALPAFAVGKTNPASCGLGSAVSLDAQAFGGFGHLGKLQDRNPGEILQSFRAQSKVGCTGNP
jgi:hypothetical protein